MSQLYNEEPYDISIVVKNNEGKEILKYSTSKTTKEDTDKLLKYLLNEVGISFEP